MRTLRLLPPGEGRTDVVACGPSISEGREVSVALSVPPGPPPFDVDRAERRLLAPAPPPLPRRQLRLQPSELVAVPNRSAALLEVRRPPAPPFLPARAREAKPEPYPAAPAGAQAKLTFPVPAGGKGKSLGTGDLSRQERREQRLIARERLPVLPDTRGGCLRARTAMASPGERASKGDRGPRTGPCPFVSCRHHLYLDINPESGAIKVNFPGLERVDAEMVEARMGWLDRRARVTATRRASRASVKLAGVTYKASAVAAAGGAPGPDTERAARAKLAAKLRPLVTAQETTLDLSLMEDTCSIDVGDRGERREARRRRLNLEVVGRKLNVTMEWARRLLEHAQDEADAKVSDGQDMRPIEEDDNDASW